MYCGLRKRKKSEKRKGAEFLTNLGEEKNGRPVELKRRAMAH